MREVLRRLRNNFGFTTTYLFRHDLEFAAQLPAPPGMEMESLYATDYDRVISLLQHWEVSAELLRKRLDTGHSCHVSLLEGVPMHFSWAQGGGEHSIDSAGKVLVIPDDTVCLYHCNTRPEARGLGLFPLTLIRAMQEYKARGARHGFAYTTKHNRSSQRGLIKAGFWRAGEMLSFGILKKHFVREQNHDR